MFLAYAREQEADPLWMYKAVTDPDTMYHHKAMRELDAQQFKQAIQKEWDDQLQNGNFTLIKKVEVPEGATILPAVWQMRQKRNIRTRQVKKYKVCLNIDGSQMQQGIHYDQMYARVTSWNSIWTMLILTALHGWKTKQINYILAFPQAPVKREIYMKIPRGFTIKEGNLNDYVLWLHQNIYTQKQAGHVWNQYFLNALVNKVGFTQSTVNECVSTE